MMPERNTTMEEQIITEDEKEDYQRRMDAVGRGIIIEDRVPYRLQSDSERKALLVASGKVPPPEK